MLQVPGADSPLRIKTDLAHTWAIGIGKEFCGAALLSMCDMNLFHGSLPNKLDQAYDAFRDWCYQNHESCKINEFSFRVLKIPSRLGILNSIRTSMEPQKLYCVLDLDCFHHRNSPAQEKPIPKASRTGPRLHCCSQMDFSFLGRRHAGWCSSLKRSMFTLCACNTCHMHAFQLWLCIMSQKNWCVRAKAERDRDYLEILKYTSDCGNAWFRSLYEFGTWIPAAQAAAMLPLGWGLTEPSLFCFGFHTPGNVSLQF